MILLVTGVYAQATLHTYTDKAAFLAATGAASATGPIPNLGQVDSAAVGALSFRPTSVDDTLYIGAFGSVAAPDWYPAAAGNEIAMTAEHLTVNAAVPVYSLGFEFIEPKNTAQPWGGTPANSTYKVMLFHGPTAVGEFLFNAPDDVVAFVGVHSSQTFDRVVIFDTTGNPDDEYFGQFYTGNVAAAIRTFRAVARSGGAIPGGGVFAAFPLGSAVAAGRTAFLGVATAAQQGLYGCDIPIPTDPCRKIADFTTSVPGATGAFTGFGEMALARVGKPVRPPIRAAFLGAGSGQQGVYLSGQLPRTAPDSHRRPRDSDSRRNRQLHRLCAACGER